MARNRKRNTNSLNLQTVFVAAGFIFIVGALAFFYVHQKNRLVFLGNEIRKMEQQIQEAREKNNVHVGTVANLKSMRTLSYKNVQWGLGLVQPHHSQFVDVDTVRGTVELRVASGAMEGVKGQ